MNEKNSKTPKNIPVSRDILLFKNHCEEIARKAIASLKENLYNEGKMKKLSEVSLILTILLNRKQVGMYNT